MIRLRALVLGIAMWPSPSAGIAERVSLPELLKAVEGTPDKTESFGTTSHAFKKDLVKFFYDIGGDLTVLEVGRFEGHTTATLSSIFSRVISVDLEPTGVAGAADKFWKYLPDKRSASNVMYLSMDIYQEPWLRFTAGNDISVVFIDAVHSFEAVTKDIHNALRYVGPSLRWLVLDDWGLPELYMGENFGVRRAAEAFEASGHISCRKDIGFPAGFVVTNPWALPNVLLEATEGKICEVLRRLDDGDPTLTPGASVVPSAYGPALPEHAALSLSNSTWWVVRAPWPEGKPIDFLQSRIHDRLEFHRLPATKGAGRVLSQLHGQGYYMPHLGLSSAEKRAVVIIRFGRAPFSSHGHTSLQMLAFPRGDHQAFSQYCHLQPGRFDLSQAANMKECDETHLFVAIRDQVFLETIKRMMYDDRLPAGRPLLPGEKAPEAIWYQE